MSYYGLGYLSVALLLLQLVVASFAIYSYQQCDVPDAESPCKSAIVNSWMIAFGVFGVLALISVVLLIWGHHAHSMKHLPKFTMSYSAMHTGVLLALTGGLSIMMRDGCTAYNSDGEKKLADAMWSVSLSSVIGGSLICVMAVVVAIRLAGSGAASGKALRAEMRKWKSHSA